MEKKFYLVLGAIILVIATAGGAAADDTSLVTVTANVNNICTAITDGTPATIQLNPTNPVAVVNGGMSVQPSIKCTMGTSHSVTCTSANGNQLVNGGNSIPYTINAGSVCGTNISGSGSTAVDLAIGIDIPGGGAATYGNLPSADYSDQITMTVFY